MLSGHSSRPRYLVCNVCQFAIRVLCYKHGNFTVHRCPKSLKPTRFIENITSDRDSG